VQPITAHPRAKARPPLGGHFGNDEDNMPATYERAPHVHRFIGYLIAKTLPPNDSDIAPVRHVQQPRHRKLATELRPLLDWRRLSNPNGGTWAEPANDNVELTHEGYQPGVECELEMRPSPEELERAWKEGGVEAALRLRKKDSFGTPKGPDERERADRINKAAKQRKLSIDALKFILKYIVGEPIEPAQLPDEHWRHIPTKHVENAEKIKARELLREFGVGREVPFEEARTRAWRYTVANDNTPAFPWRPSDPRKIFHCGKIRANPMAAPSGEFHDGVSYAEAERHEFAHLRGKLSKKSVKTLDAAPMAENFRDIGEALGFNGEKHAQRKGKQLLLDACAELKTALAGR
jgi:hypothetical protein